MTTVHRQRRSTDEVKRLILDSARLCFRSTGYANTTTKEVARLAGVSETVVYRHYPAKETLFEQAVLSSIADFIRRFIEWWEAEYHDRPHDPALPARQFIEGLYELLHENRGLLRAYLAALSFGDLNDGGRLAEELTGPLFARLEALGEEEFGFLELGGIDIPVSVRATFGMVLTLAVYGEWLFPKGSMPSRERIVEECSRLVVDGWAHREATER